MFSQLLACLLCDTESLQLGIKLDVLGGRIVIFIFQSAAALVVMCRQRCLLPLPLETSSSEVTLNSKVSRSVQERRTHRCMAEQVCDDSVAALNTLGGASSEDGDVCG